MPLIPQAAAGKALVFAWMVEAIAVSMGLVLAVFAGVEGSNDGAAAIAVAILPFIALSVIELTKIPLVGLAFRVDRLHWRLLACVALVCVTAATFENFVFGFERGFNERIRAVQAAEARVAALRNLAQSSAAPIDDMSAAETDLEHQLAGLRGDMSAARQQAAADIAATQGTDDSADINAERQRLQAQLIEIDRARDAALAIERRRCAVAGVACRYGAISANARHQHDEIDRQFGALETRARDERQSRAQDERAARDRRNTDLDGESAAARGLQAQLDALRGRRAAARSAALAANAAIGGAVHERDALIERSQLHRLSDIVFGNHEKPALERTERFFVVTLAAIVAVIGTVVAAMHYAALAAAPPRRRPLVNALRGWLARRRRRMPVLRDIHAAARQRQRLLRSLRAWIARRRRRVLRTVIREVPVDRLKIVYLPLDAAEDQVAAARREAARGAA